MSSEEFESSSSEDEFGEDQEVSQEERETYQKIRKEMYNIRKRQQKRVFDVEDEEPRLIDILKEAKKDKGPSYDPDTWDDTKFVIATIFFSGLIAWGTYSLLHYLGMYEEEDYFWHGDDL